MKPFDFHHMNFGFVGFGLIGGSLARSLKEAFPSCHVTVFSRSQAPLLAAQADGNADTLATAIDHSFSLCDMIFLCTPVEYNEFYLQQLQPFLKPGCILTDVGSVKGPIHRCVHRLKLEAFFIGGHPMAGSEKTGYANSSSSLLKGAFYAITPTPQTTPAALEQYVSLVEAIGAVALVLDPAVHDRSVAGISHLPHLVAASLVELIERSDDDNHTMHTLAAGGFKDITRIASSSAEVWEQICFSNKEAIRLLLERYIASLEELLQALDEENKPAIHDLFIRSKKYRDTF